MRLPSLAARSFDCLYDSDGRFASAESLFRIEKKGEFLRTPTPGILLAARLLVTRAGGSSAPISTSYQQAGAKMKKREERIRCFLLLLFLWRSLGLEIRHGAVVAFDLWTRPLCNPLASGHCLRLGASTSSSRRVHYSLICESARCATERTGNDLATRVGAPRIHKRGADSPMPERW